MKMKLLTKAIRKTLPKLYETEGIETVDKIARVKFFNPYGAGTWLVFEFDGEDTFFGMVNLFGDWEAGYFSLSEMESLKAVLYGRKMPFQGIERDRNFKPCKFGTITNKTA